MSSCCYPECASPAHARQLCQRHYRLVRLAGTAGDYAVVHRPVEGRVCEWEGCDAPIHLGGRYCPTHRYKVWHDDTPHPMCSVEGCSAGAISRGFCDMHYQRQHSGKEDMARERGPRGQGTITDTGYRAISVGGKRDLEHRALWTATNGPIPKGRVVHHINGDKLDNRVENMELMTRAQHIAEHRAALQDGLRRKKQGT